MQSRTKTVIFYVYLLFLNAFGEDSDVGNANDFVDEVLENLAKSLSVSSGLDPLKVPDFEAEGFSAWDITIRGLSSLHRYGDCTLRYDDSEEVANITGELAVKDVNIFLRYKAKALFFWIYGRIYGRLDHLAVRMTLSVEEGKPSLKSLKVINLGDYTITKITGLSFALNWLLRIIVNGIAQRSRGQIIHALEHEAAEALNELISQAELPFKRK